MKDRYYEDYDFEDIKLYEEVVENCRFVDCTFTNCTFDEVRLINSQLIDCKFEKSSILNLKGEGNTEMQSVSFIACQLVGINWGDFTYEGAFVDPLEKIEKSSLKFNTFFNLNLKKFDFSNNEIIESLFTESDLVESKFDNCRLERTEFIKSDLRKADFRDSSGYEIDIATCLVKAARFSFPEVINLLKSLEIKID